jgi:hypothetical protein
MPFQSDKQRRYLWANEPEIAREWTNRYGASQGGLTRLRQAYPTNLTFVFENAKHRNTFSHLIF